MKKKFLTFLLSVLFVLPCMILLSACGGQKKVYLSQISTDNPQITYGERFHLNLFNASLLYSDGTEQKLDLEAESPVEGLTWEVYELKLVQDTEESGHYEEVLVDEIPELPDVGEYSIHIHYETAKDGPFDRQANLAIIPAQRTDIPEVEMSSNEFAWGDEFPSVSITPSIEDVPYYFILQLVDENGEMIMDQDEFGNEYPAYQATWIYEAGEKNNSLNAGHYRLYATFEAAGNYAAFETESVFFTVTEAVFDESYQLENDEITIYFEPGKTKLKDYNYLLNGLTVLKGEDVVAGIDFAWADPEKTIDELEETEEIIMRAENFEDKVLTISVNFHACAINEPWNLSLFNVDAEHDANLSVSYDGQTYSIVNIDSSEIRGEGANEWTFYRASYKEDGTQELVPVFRATANSTFSATNAGDYYVEFELIDKEHTIWSNQNNTENYVVEWHILPLESTSAFFFVIDGERYAFGQGETIRLDYKNFYNVSVLEVKEDETEVFVNANTLSFESYEGGNIDGVTLQANPEQENVMVLASEMIQKSILLLAEIPQDGNTAQVLGSVHVFIGTKVFTEEEKTALRNEVPHLSYEIESSHPYTDGTTSWEVAVTVPDGLIPTALHEDGSWCLVSDTNSFASLNAGDEFGVAVFADDAPESFTWSLIFTPSDPKFGGEYYFEVPITITIKNNA